MSKIFPATDNNKQNTPIPRTCYCQCKVIFVVEWFKKVVWLTNANMVWNISWDSQFYCFEIYVKCGSLGDFPWLEYIMKPPHRPKPSSSSKISEKGPPHHLNESSSSDGILITVFFRIHCESWYANARSIYCVCRYNCRPNFVCIMGVQREKQAPEKNTLIGRRHLGWGGSGSSSSLSPVWDMVCRHNKVSFLAAIKQL